VAYDIFRSDKPFLDPALLREPVASVPTNSWTDLPESAGSYYYTVTFRSGMRTNRKIVAARNSLAVPVSWSPRPAVASVPANVTVLTQVAAAAAATDAAGPEVMAGRMREIELEFTNALIPAYYAKKFKEVIKLGQRISDDKDCPEGVRLQAGLFMGKSWYYLGEEAKALKIFIELRKTYPEESTFWIDTIGNRP
jgi:hypothetical protein